MTGLWIQNGIGTHWKGAHSLDFRWHRRKTKTGVGQLLEPAHVLDDGNARAEQHSVNGAMAVIRAVDVERIDTDQRDAPVAQIFRGLACEKRMAFEISIRAPMSRGVCARHAL